MQPGAGRESAIGPVSLLLLGDFVAAEMELRRAVDLDPEDPAGWNNLGLALGHLERYAEALEAFRKGGDEQGARNNLGDLEGDRLAA